MRFEFRLVGTGWAEAHITDGTSHATMSASYTTRALDDLLYAVWRLLQGDVEARFSWDAEPVESRWLMRRDGDVLSVRVLQFADYFRKLEDEAGKLVFETRQPIRTFARAIALGAAGTLERYGEHGYAFEWDGGPFPTKTLELIQDDLRRGGQTD